MEMVKGGETFLHKCSRVTGIKFCNLTFTKNFSHLTIHVQVNNKVVLAYLLKMGVTHNFQRSASQFRVICYIIR